MSLSSFCVKRPVTASMFYVGIMLLGAISWFSTPRELFPSISFPQLLIITRYGNAAPEEIENLITKVIEESVGTVPDLKRARSLSKEGISLVTLEFDWGTNMGFAHLATREKIDQIKDRLPDEAEDPIINRINPLSQPMMIFSISGDMKIDVLTDVTKKVVKQRLEKVKGVASAVISGGQDREILVEVDRGRMESRRISLSSIVDAIRDTNLNYPAGTTQGKFYEYLVVTKGEYQNIKEIGQTVVKVEKPPTYKRPNEELSANRSTDVKQDRLVHLNTIADVKDTLKEKTSYSRHNARENISVAIQKQADANTITTAKRVRTAMEELRLSLPRGMRMDLIYDESKFIVKAVNGVALSGVMGGLLSFLVLYFFLRSWGTSTIVALAIPTTVMITFVAMYFKGISINLLSLAGLGLVIGSMVDNSIVVAENITRHHTDLQKSIKDSAVDGAEEVAAPMIASSLTNVAVLLPLLFAKGVAQMIFKDMFFVVACASFATLFISITLVPLMKGHAFLKRKPETNSNDHNEKEMVVGAGLVSARSEETQESRFKKFTTLSDEAFNKIIDIYQRMLAWVLVHPVKTTIITLLAMSLSIGLLIIQDRVFMPKFDQGQFLLKVQMPVGTRLEVTNRVAEKMEGILKSIPGLKSLTVNVGSSGTDSVEALGSHQAQALVSIDRDTRSTDDFIGALKRAVGKENMEGAEIHYILQDSVLASVFETAAPIVVEVKGPDLPTLKKISEDIMRDISTVPGIYGVKTSLALPSAETRVNIDKERAAGYQLSVAEIARTALIGIKGYVASMYKEEGQEVGIRVQLRAEDRKDISDIRHLTVRTQNNVMVPLSELAELRTARGPSEIKRLNQQRAVVVSANILKRSTSDVIADVSKKLEQYQNLTDYNVFLSGESAQMKETFGGLAVAMILAIVLVYMIMAAEFESLWNPFIIMITIPFSVIGVAFSLFLTNTPLSASVILGVILLAGGVVNYGIVLIDFINQQRRPDEDLWVTVIRSSATRLRPILMSSLTTMLAVFPLAAGLTEGSELSSPMAVVTFGGLGISVLLSLFVVPMIYYHGENRRMNRLAE